jgi:hypothetical protein
MFSTFSAAFSESGNWRELPAIMSKKVRMRQNKTYFCRSGPTGGLVVPDKTKEDIS